MWPPGFGEPARYSYPEHDNWTVTRDVCCPICGPSRHSYSAKDLNTPRWCLLMRSTCPTCGAKFTVLKVVTTWYDGKDICTHSRDFRLRLDLTLQRLARMVYNAPNDPRPLSRLLYYLSPAHPDNVERGEVEAMVRVTIEADTWWAAWEELKKLRRRIEPQGGE